MSSLIGFLYREMQNGFAVVIGFSRKHGAQHEGEGLGEQKSLD